MRLIVLSVIFAVAAFAQTADLAITNAKIYTVDPKQPNASAMAVRDGKILAVGKDVSRLIGSETTLIDAHGATILPGDRKSVV